MRQPELCALLHRHKPSSAQRLQLCMHSSSVQRSYTPQLQELAEEQPALVLLQARTRRACLLSSTGCTAIWEASSTSHASMRLPDGVPEVAAMPAAHGITSQQLV